MLKRSSRRYFNPRSPHGERRWKRWGTSEVSDDISIHAPRTGSDLNQRNTAPDCSNFNPRSPHGERLHAGGVFCHLGDFNPRSPHGERPLGDGIIVKNPCISIHAPRTGSDRSIYADVTPTEDISIHAPRTGSDGRDGLLVSKENISIHAPRTGSDLCRACDNYQQKNFNPRSPHGERPY